MAKAVLLLTRDLAFALAKDQVRLRHNPHGCFYDIRMTPEIHDEYVDELRKLWTLDDEFTEQEFVARHGRSPRPFDEADYREVRRIWNERKAAGHVYGPFPTEAQP